jgi:hypothetical protein
VLVINLVKGRRRGRGEEAVSSPPQHRAPAALQGGPCRCPRGACTGHVHGLRAAWTAVEWWWRAVGRMKRTCSRMELENVLAQGGRTVWATGSWQAAGAQSAVRTDSRRPCPLPTSVVVVTHQRCTEGQGRVDEPRACPALRSRESPTSRSTGTLGCRGMPLGSIGTRISEGTSRKAAPSCQFHFGGSA